MLTFNENDVLVQVYGPGDRPEAFWRLAGPLFGDAAVLREFGGPFTDDGHTIWALAVTEAGPLRGLASVRVERGVGLLDHAYVLPAHRRQGVHQALLRSRVAAAPEVSRFRVAANPHSLIALIRLGFIANGKRGKYVQLEADAVLLRAKLDLKPVLTLRA